MSKTLEDNRELTDTILTLALDAGYTPTEEFGDDELLSFSQALLSLPTPATACDTPLGTLVAKLRYMGKQYAAGQASRGGGVHKHYLEEAADELERLHELADSEGTRAVEYLRRARKAEDDLRCWEAALAQTWRMVDPLKPAGEPGSYARGQDSGITAALHTLRANLANLKTPNVEAKPDANGEQA